MNSCQETQIKDNNNNNNFGKIFALYVTIIMNLVVRTQKIGISNRELFDYKNL